MNTIRCLEDAHHFILKIIQYLKARSLNMYSWVAFPLLRITLLFAVGIVAAVEFPSSWSRLTILTILAMAFAVYFLLWNQFGKSKFFSLNVIFGFVGNGLVILSGYTSLVFHNEALGSNHLLYAPSFSAYTILIKDQPDIKEKTIRVEAEVLSIMDSTGWENYHGKVYVYIRKDSLAKELAYGDVLLISGSPNLTQKPKNPGEFDYKRYLSFQNIHHQDFIKSEDYKLLDSGQGYLLYDLAIKSRAYLKSILYNHIQSERERAIAMALLLGTKDELTPDINQAYASAGAMHVLAVSGLHVGIIYGLMLVFFKKSQKGKFTQWVFLIVTLTGLTSYAMITGLSASVLRAVTMFSLMTIAKVTKRESNIYNTLSAAGLILLCVDPYMIMSVGFQLSFLAVFGIVYITPKIYHLLTIDQYILDKMWMVTCVSISAQIATVPLTMLYFHQFPTYFFISNLVVIPAAFLILATGIALFISDFIPYVGDLTGQILERMIFFTNEFVFLIERIPYNTINELFIDTTQSWLIILGVISFFAWIHYRRLFPLAILSVVSLSFITINEVRAYENSECKQIVFYSIGQHTAIDFIQDNKGYLYTDSILLANASKKRFHIEPNRLRAGVSTHVNNGSSISLIRKIIKGNELIVWNGKSILILKNAKHRMNDLQVDVLVIANNSVYGPRQLESIKFDLLIFDGSNSHYRTNRLMKDEVLNNFIVIDLIEAGAYTMTLY